MHFGEMAEELFCGARSQMCRLRSAVLRAGVTAGRVQWDKESSTSCQGLLLSAQEAGGCGAVIFLCDFHLEPLESPKISFFSCWGVGTMQVQSLCAGWMELSANFQLYRLCQTWNKTNWFFSSYCGTDILEVFFCNKLYNSKTGKLWGRSILIIQLMHEVMYLLLLVLPLVYLSPQCIDHLTDSFQDMLCPLTCSMCNYICIVTHRNNTSRLENCRFWSFAAQCSCSMHCF